MACLSWRKSLNFSCIYVKGEKCESKVVAVLNVKMKLTGFHFWG